jgi:hypothetical protein
VSPSTEAELLADRGAAAAEAEFFRSAEFLGAEGVTHTLRIGPIVAPLVVREIPGADGLLDAVSPYGYPGFAAPAGPRLDVAEVDFGPTRLVSAFIRHRLGADPPLTGSQARNVVQIADPALPRKSRPSDRRQIRRNERSGYAVEVVPGAEVSPERRDAFVAVYEQTMRRTEAGDRYFFGAEYFERLLSSPLAWLALAFEPGGQLAAGSLATQSDGMVHYYLSGTADAQLGDSPMKNVVSALVDFAAERELPLNLCGGISPGDPLEEFKRGFANRTEAWRTSEIVCDQPAYERLSAGREPGGFFPAYRAPQ